MEYYIKCSISWSSVEYIDLYRFGYNIDIIVVSEIQVFILGHTNIFHCEQTEAITLFQANKSDSLYFFQRISPTPLHFSKRIKYKSYKVFWSYDLFPIIKYLLERKPSRKPQKSQENHYLCIQQAFCNIPAEMPYHSTPCI